ncbi:hypothetical protein [Parasitella parasitica]|uniref:Rhodanese domain-containing protein n=1 Tax=Parasitella parasitica TaxID=35722 RepID=A0A0B7N7P3_9FUNG|nr:hypothetical protein [Parasitella parasitica]
MNNSKRLLQNVFMKSAGYSLQKLVVNTTPSAAVRSCIILNRSAFSLPVRNSLIQQRQYSNKTEPSLFRVVDYNNIQSVIKDSDKKYSLIDVREEKEVIQGAIPTAKNVPLSQFAAAWSLSDQEFKEQFGFEKPAKDASVILYCLGGVRSTRAAEHLASLGYNNFSIDKSIEEESRKLRREFKILLLGSGESGKSTIFKQMKIIHQNGYTNEELLNWRVTVYRNLIHSAQAIVKALHQFEYELQSEKVEYEAQRIIEYRLEENIDPSFIDAVISVWRDPAVTLLLDNNSTEFYLMDSAPYFFEDIKRIGQHNYIPTPQDVLRARSKTTGIVETKFMIKDTSIHMFDVGGQRSERKKWIHCFEAVKSIIFCVSLSEYDQVLLEESRQNRLMESLVLFESVVNSRWFLRTTIILFLNKIDVFQQKFKKIPLKNFFPDYEGGSDINKAIKYILWRFNQTNRAKLNIYPHVTQATNTSNIAHVFNAIKDTIIQNHLKDSGIL